MSQQNFKANPANIEGQVCFGQVVEFLSRQWKKLVLGGVVGIAVAITLWAAFASYSAETVLNNNKIGQAFINVEIEQINNKQPADKDAKPEVRTLEVRAINYVSWRNLQKSLPILAAQLAKSPQSKTEELEQLKLMEKSEWWKKNVVPSYSLSKSDTKDLAIINKEMQDTEGQTILNLLVTTQGASEDQALNNLNVATQFIRAGSSYLSLKSLIGEYEALVLYNESDLQKKISDAEVELKFLQERAHNLEAMRLRFPGNVSVASQQITDLKDSSAKYMPISTQLVAVSADIDKTQEQLKRMQGKVAQMKLLRKFIDIATPMIDTQTDGLKLAGSLIQQTTDLRTGLAINDLNAQQILNTVQADIAQIQARFTGGLEPSATGYVSSPSLILPAIGGGLAGILIALVSILGRISVARYKKQQT